MDSHGATSSSIRESHTLVEVEKHYGIILDKLDLPDLALLQAESGDRDRSSRANTIDGVKNKTVNVDYKMETRSVCLFQNLYISRSHTAIRRIFGFCRNIDGTQFVAVDVLT